MSKSSGRSPKNAAPKASNEPNRARGGDDEFQRCLVLLPPDGEKQGVEDIKKVSGLSVSCNTQDCGVLLPNVLNSDDGILFGRINVAVVNADPEQCSRLYKAADEKNAIVAVEYDRVLAAINQELTPDYYRGFYDGVQTLLHINKYVNRSSHALTEELERALADFADDEAVTWGLKATQVHKSRYGGHNIKIAILDTGMDQAHIDFAQRTTTIASFINGESPLDRNGHGTHCIGTALGPQAPFSGVRRYGCAFQGGIFSGKVLGDNGEGTNSSALGGIEWAIANECRVVSMSLGGRNAPGEGYSVIFEEVAKRALGSSPGTLIVAATGNDSMRHGGRIAEAQHPANCPSILGVGAVGNALQIAPFSNAGADIAAPGVNIFSSCLQGKETMLSGTSMAAPHVAGIAGLWFEALGPDVEAAKVVEALKKNARRLDTDDAGAGLVQAPA